MVQFDARTALLIVDVQNDFADPRGSLYVAGAEATLPVINAAQRKALAAGARVVYSRDWHPPRTPHFQIDGGIWPVHCLEDSWGAEFHPRLEVIDAAEQVLKGGGGEDGYSAFSVRDPRSGATERTRLASLLNERGIERLVIAGLATDYCVRESALDALRLGFEVVLLRSGIAAVDLQPGDGERAIAAVIAAGGRVE
jgi:nicotinamidase/pyrazinamidase